MVTGEPVFTELGADAVRLTPETVSRASLVIEPLRTSKVISRLDKFPPWLTTPVNMPLVPVLLADEFQNAEPSTTCTVTGAFLITLLFESSTCMVAVLVVVLISLRFEGEKLTLIFAAGIVGVVGVVGVLAPGAPPPQAPNTVTMTVPSAINRVRFI
jgi:hypothetical protein